MIIIVEEKPIYPMLPEHYDPELKTRKTPGIPRCAQATPYNGIYLAIAAVDPIGQEVGSPQWTELNFTGPPGTGSAIYYALVFQLPKWDYNTVKADEWIEVAPTHREYYERTVATKEALANTIKQGLASATASIADFEMAKHDVRKYKEILTYFEEVEKAVREKNDKAVLKANHALRAMFVDQIDVHNGNMAMVQMVQRWSTLIADFMKLPDNDLSAEDIKKKLGAINMAEATILKTKNRLFLEWKKLFGAAARERYETLKSLVQARQKSIEEYKDWVKPYLIRFKMMKTGHERKEVSRSLMKSFADITGQSTFSNKVTIWCWKIFRPEEHRKMAVEKESGEKDFIVDPWDMYVREKFVLDPEYGLASPKFYPWLAEKPLGDPNKLQIVKDGTISPDEATRADEIAEEIKKKWKTGEDKLSPTELYYVVMEIEVVRLGVRTAAGELEDITFRVKTQLFSQNIMLVKLIELWCRDHEIERYVDEMLGFKQGSLDIKSLVEREYPTLFGKSPEEKNDSQKFWDEWKSVIKEYDDYFRNLSRKLRFPHWFMKAGPYEHDWTHRISKQYIKIAGKEYYAPIIAFLKMKFGIE